MLQMRNKQSIIHGSALYDNSGMQQRSEYGEIDY